MMFSIWNRDSKITLQILVAVGLDFFTYTLKNKL